METNVAKIQEEASPSLRKTEELLKQCSEIDILIDELVSKTRAIRSESPTELKQGQDSPSEVARTPILQAMQNLQEHLSQIIMRIRDLNGEIVA